MKQLNQLFAIAVLSTSLNLMADIKAPAQLNCVVKSVTPAGAKFFGFGPSPKLNDTTRLDLDAREIEGIHFASGAHIGSTVTKHPLIKASKTFNGLSFHEAKFTSQTTQKNYHAVLTGRDDDKSLTVRVSLDVTETAELGRIHLNSLELICTRP